MQIMNLQGMGSNRTRRGNKYRVVEGVLEGWVTVERTVWRALFNLFN